MDHRGEQRPPRSARPGQQSQSRSPAPTYPDQPINQPARPTPFLPNDGSRGNVSFQNVERGDRHGPLDPQRQRTMQSAYQPHLPAEADPENAEYYDPARVGRKKSLVRPDREKIEPGHRQWHYRSHVAQLEEEGPGRVGVMASSTYYLTVHIGKFTSISLSPQRQATTHN